MTTRRLALATLISAVLTMGSTGGCNNDNLSNSGVISTGARFQLVVEEDPTPARLLLDSATGDLWQLSAEPAAARWVRVASGPTDARVLSPQESLGISSSTPPKP